MKKIFLLSISMLAFGLLMSCDKLKEATSLDIKVNNVKFNFTTEVNGSEMATSSNNTSIPIRAGAVNSFSDTYTVDISEIGNAEVAEYANKINKIVVNDSKVVITTIPTENFTFTDLTFSAVGVSGSLTIPSYTIGSTFTPPAGMNTYTLNFFTKLLAVKSLVLTISGQTDAPAGTIVNISYENNLVFTASLL